MPKGRYKTISCGHHPQFLAGEDDHDGREGVTLILDKRVTMILVFRVTMILVYRVNMILVNRVTMILVKNFESNLVDGDVS